MIIQQVCSELLCSESSFQRATALRLGVSTIETNQLF